MSLYRELVYMVLDELKLISDDSHFQEEHVIFLLDKYRALLLKQNYGTLAREIPDSNYQTICLDLEPYSVGDSCGSEDYLRSTNTVPYLLDIGLPRVTSLDPFKGNFTYVSMDRFKYVGNNRFLKNEVYGTIAPDQYLYMKSNNPQMYHLKKVKVTGVFEDSLKAAELSCDDTDNKICDVMDRQFPIEEALIQPLIQMAVQELGNKLLIPADDVNNASDDLQKLAQYIAQNLKKRRNTDTDND